MINRLVIAPKIFTRTKDFKKSYYYRIQVRTSVDRCITLKEFAELANKSKEVEVIFSVINSQAEFSRSLPLKQYATDFDKERLLLSLIEASENFNATEQGTQEGVKLLNRIIQAGGFKEYVEIMEMDI